nr:DUF1700 domain-containing protein [uncultured Mediterraneibacter sp.]
MNRTEFMTELEKLLADMPNEERQAAVQYYADYFADAGEENESEVIRELGSPQKVAESIKADYYGKEFNESEFEHRDYMEKYGQRSGKDTDENRGDGMKGNAQEKNKPWTSTGLKLVLIVLIAIVVWPVSLGVVCAVLGIAAAVVSIFACLVIAAIAVMIAGGIVMTVGLFLLATVPPAALITIGCGLLIFVIGLAATAGSVKLCLVVYPAMLKGFVNLCRRPLYGKAV